MGLDVESRFTEGRISAVPLPPFSSLIPSSATRTRRGPLHPAAQGWIREIYTTSFFQPEVVLNDMNTLLLEEEP